MKSTTLPLSLLVPDPDQARKTIPTAELNQLVESIRTRGLLLPLRVKPADAAGTHVIVSGHRRFAALQKLGVTEVPCIVVEGPIDDATILAEQLAENLHRENLNPIEEAEGYRRYITLKGIAATQAAEELHVPPARISRALPLLDLPEAVHAAVQAGTIPKDTAYYLSRLPKGDARNGLIAQALAGSLSRDRAARAAKATQPQPVESAVTRVTCKLAGGRSLTASGAMIHIDSLIEMLELVFKEARKARSQSLDVSTLARVLKNRAANGVRHEPLETVSAIPTAVAAHAATVALEQTRGLYPG